MTDPAQANSYYKFGPDIPKERVTLAVPTIRFTPIGATAIDYNILWHEENGV